MTPTVAAIISRSETACRSGSIGHALDDERRRPAAGRFAQHPQLLADRRRRAAADGLLGSVGQDEPRRGARGLGERPDAGLAQRAGDEARGRGLAARAVDVHADRHGGARAVAGPPLGEAEDDEQGEQAGGARASPTWHLDGRRGAGQTLRYVPRRALERAAIEPLRQVAHEPAPWRG